MDSILTAMGKVGSSLRIQTTIQTQMDSILTAMGKLGSSLRIQATIHTDGLLIDSHGQTWKQSKDSDYHTHRWTPY